MSFTAEEILEDFAEASERVRAKRLVRPWGWKESDAQPSKPRVYVDLPGGVWLRLQRIRIELRHESLTQHQECSSCGLAVEIREGSKMTYHVLPNGKLSVGRCPALKRAEGDDR